MGGLLIGGLLGFFIADGIGLVFGAISGHVIDRFRASGRRDRRRQRGHRTSETGSSQTRPLFDDPTETRRIAFATAIIILGAKLAKADGRVSRDEVAAFKSRFKISEDEVGGVAQIYNQAKQSAEGFEPYARQIATLFGRDPIMLEELLIGFFEVARADGELKRGEIEFLREVATIFGFGEAKFEQLRATFGVTGQTKREAEDPYRLLGVSRGSSNAEIKTAYRKLVRELHPDQLMAKGLPEDFINRANDRLATINSAYDRIEKARGL